MKLSKRLRMSADMVTPGNRVADVGCDHAYCSIYIVEQGISPHVIATDLRQGPLSRAAENIRNAGLSEVIETRLSDGLMMLSPGEADTVLISGMGGRLITGILGRDRVLLHSIKELVLQPQSEWQEVRHFLRKEGFRIADEDMCIDDGKYYVSIHAVKDDGYVSERQQSKLRETAGLRFGDILIENKHPILIEYLMKEIDKCSAIIDGLAGKETFGTKNRALELEEERALMSELLEEMQA